MRGNPYQATYEEAKNAIVKDFESGDMVAYPFVKELFLEVLEVVYLRNGWGKTYIVELPATGGCQRAVNIITAELLAYDKRNWK